MRPYLLCLGMLVGCVKADILRVEPPPLVDASVRSVPILLDEPDRPYRSIALIEVYGSWGPSLERLGRRLAAEAAKAGGDAVLLTRSSRSTTSSVIPAGESSMTVDSEHARLVGKVIVYLVK